MMMMMMMNGTTKQKRKANTSYVILFTSWLLLAVAIVTVHHVITRKIIFCSALQHPHTNYLHHRNFQVRRRREHQRQPSTKKTTRAAAVAAETTTTSKDNNSIEYRQLYPQSTSQMNGTMITEDGKHTLYYEIHGHGKLKSLFLHGGPGSGCYPNHARFFDPTRYSVVLVDQRGSGRSIPKGSVINNTLSYLVDDCEVLRKHLSISEWDVILGGSWGTTLAVAYAQTYPTAMKSLLLRGICTLRPSEVDWLFNANCGSASKLTESWKNFSDGVNIDVDVDVDDDSQEYNDGRDILHAYYDRLMINVDNTTTDDDDDAIDNNSIRLAAAKSWMMWEMAASSSYQTNQSADDNTYDKDKDIVLVSRPDNNGRNSCSWLFENRNGEEVYDYLQSSPETIVSQLRQGIVEDRKGLSKSHNNNKGPTRTSGPRQTRLIDSIVSPSLVVRTNNENSKNDNNTNIFRLPSDYIPAQAMLTCYYSVNDVFVMGNRYQNLLSKESCSQFNEELKIIGIHGGNDPICPPDTALDLNSNCLSLNINIELRVPIKSGHSMYDPAIMHELILATDKLADEFLLSDDSIQSQNITNCK